MSLYFAAVVFIGFRAGGKENPATDDFLLAGRTLTLPVFVATLVSTWYGGILGVGEYSYRFGISNWFVFGVPYYIFAFFFALFLAKKVRATNLVTIPDKLEQAYDTRTAIAGGILTFLLVTPAAYVLMLGILAQLIFGLDLTVCIIITTFLTVVYLYKGGFRSDVWANVFRIRDDVSWFCPRCGFFLFKIRWIGFYTHARPAITSYVARRQQHGIYCRLVLHCIMDTCRSGISSAMLCSKRRKNGTTRYSRFHLLLVCF